ncbi:MAG: flagellar hook-basal body complex protein FliE [Eubacteriales bacterium]
MDISALSQVGSGVIQEASESQLSGQGTSSTSSDLFSAILQSAMETVNQTNAYAQEATEEKMKLALGETESTHDLTIALQKSSTALQYTVALRDGLLDAYKEIMNMQI